MKQDGLTSNGRHIGRVIRRHWLGIILLKLVVNSRLEAGETSILEGKGVRFGASGLTLVAIAADLFKTGTVRFTHMIWKLSSGCD